MKKRIVKQLLRHVREKGRSCAEEEIKPNFLWHFQSKKNDESSRISSPGSIALKYFLPAA